MRLYIMAFFAVMVLLGSGLAARDSCAATVLVPGTGCDQHYWDSLSWRGWMEGKHDMESAQVIIRKQHSVLEVSCFDSSLRILGRAANTMFSDNLTNTAMWATAADRTFNPRDPPYEPTIRPNHTYSDILGGSGSIGYALLDIQRMDDVLQQAVWTSMNFYLQNNFTRPVTLGPTVAPPNPPNNSLCDTMNRMWNASRCSTFDRSTFYTFEQMLNTEPRANEIYGCQFGAAPGTYFPRLRWDIAMNGRNSPQPPGAFIAGAFPEPDTPAGSQPNTRGGMDAALMWMNSILGLQPNSMNSLCASQLPIYTGVKARRNITTGAEDFDDAICFGFGCRYNHTTRRCQAN